MPPRVLRWVWKVELMRKTMTRMPLVTLARMTIRMLFGQGKQLLVWQVAAQKSTSVLRVRLEDMELETPLRRAEAASCCMRNDMVYVKKVGIEAWCESSKEDFRAISLFLGHVMAFTRRLS